MTEEAQEPKVLGLAVCQRKRVRSNPGESCVTKSKGGPVFKGCWSTAFVLWKSQVRTKEILDKTENK